MVDLWHLTINAPDMDEPDHLELYDIKEVLDEYIQVKRDFFDVLISSAQKNSNYGIGKGIEKITSPNNEDWTQNPWVLIMSKDSEAGTPFWVLLTRERNLSGYIVALGPKGFVEYLGDTNVDEEDEFKKVLEYIISYPKKFNTIILIPNFIE